MSRDANVTTYGGQSAAATAGTVYQYYPVPVVFEFEGFSWCYTTTEANADNTFDFVIEYDSAGDGTFATALHTNANAVGLLDSAAVGQFLTNKGNAAAGGGAAVAVTPTKARIPAGASIRVTVIRAGTGTIPAINFAVHGHTLTPLASA